jgi:hypothetical protein
MATCWPGVRFPAEASDFLFSTVSRPCPIQWVQRSPSPGLKRPGCDADHSPPSIAKVKLAGTIHPLPHTSPAVIWL